MVERTVSNGEAVGSIPSFSKFLFCFFLGLGVFFLASIGHICFFYVHTNKTDNLLLLLRRFTLSCVNRTMFCSHFDTPCHFLRPTVPTSALSSCASAVRCSFSAALALAGVATSECANLRLSETGQPASTTVPFFVATRTLSHTPILSPAMSTKFNLRGRLTLTGQRVALLTSAAESAAGDSPLTELPAAAFVPLFFVSSFRSPSVCEGAHRQDGSIRRRHHQRIQG